MPDERLPIDEQQRPLPRAVPPDEPLLQFSLQWFLLFVAGVSVFLAVVVSIPGNAKIIVTVGVLITLLHVVATIVGGRLRARSRKLVEWRLAQGVPDPEESSSREPFSTRHEQHVPSESPLGSSNTRLSWIPLLVFIGAVAGAAIGGMGLSATVGHRITMPGLILGSLSTAALGAWIAFLVSGFVGISRHAWREAVAGQQRDRELRK